jgi:cytochrome c-type biogenesis protein CcsB
VQEFITHANKYLQYDPNGEPLIHLITTSLGGKQEAVLSEDQVLKNGRMIFHFVGQNSAAKQSTEVQFFLKNDSLYFYTPVEVLRISMMSHTSDTLLPGTFYPFTSSMLYYFGEIPIVLKQFLNKGKIDIQTDTDRNSDAPSALRIKLTCDNISEKTIIFGKKDEPGHIRRTDLKGIVIGLSYGSLKKSLPFSLHLNDFIINRYPGSQSPSWYESDVHLRNKMTDPGQEYRIYMNHTLKYRGYRFYQSSYDQDEKGTVLSVNQDKAGTAVTYLGYALLALGMLLSLLNKNSRFYKLAQTGSTNSRIASAMTIGLLIIGSGIATCQTSDTIYNQLPKINKELAADFGKILVQNTRGRVEPLNTLASEVLRKVSRKELYHGQNPDQVLLGMWVHPGIWQHERMIKVSHPEIRQLLKLTSEYASYADFFTHDHNGKYVLKDQVEIAYRKKPGNRSKFDNELIRLDERVNICYFVYNGMLFKIFPDPDDSTHLWHSPVTAPEVLNGKDSIFSKHVLDYLGEEIQASEASLNYELPFEMIKAIKTFQLNYGKEIIPDETRIRAEIFYNHADLFNRIARYYLLIGMILLLIQFIHFFVPRFNLRWYIVPAAAIVIILFVVHSFVLGLRWYVAGHAPWSNGYETLTFIAWATVLAGLIFSRRSAITISSTSVLSALILQTAHLGWMDPQITNLVPVLQSHWLIIHVAVITISYGFLGLGSLIAVINLILMSFQSSRNYERFQQQISQLSAIDEMTLIIGLYLLTIGTFLGGIWANESWGRYWAWDPKEAWALVTIIVYAVILHVKLVPELKSRLLFNVLALIGFGSVIMTYFGVNYYLTGLHSYAQGDPLPVPPVTFYCIAAVILISVLAFINQYRLKKSNTEN